MAFKAGTRVGAYEIVGLLGAGGMGEVYRARDTRLNRSVAIKALLAAVAGNPDRLARFRREAQLLASLNHVNIAQIHGFEEQDGVSALVMELVEGPTLADLISNGPLPLPDALAIARQIAEALEAAHERGVIHRDLKPANIKVRTDGVVKVLDFGLAKALDPEAAATANATISPTLSLHATQAGVILGTAAYMSPEQARGRVLDARTDIWSFGCVLFEALAGRRAFDAPDITDTLVAVLSKDPDWALLPASAGAVRPLLMRCLRKDPKQRLQAIGDARIHVEELLAAPPADGARADVPAPGARRRMAMALGAGAAAGAALAALATWIALRPAPPAPVTPTRVEIAVPAAQPLAIHGSDRDIAISPDGQQIAYRSLTHLVVRSLVRLETRAIDAVPSLRQPFFSPDGQWIGFFDGSGLKKVAVAGGKVITVYPTQSVLRGASWGEDDTIVFATFDTTTGLMRVPGGGGEATVLTTPDAARGERDHWYPSLLPGDRGVLFTVVESSQPRQSAIGVLDSRTGQRKTLVRGSYPEYVDTGHLLFMADGALSAIRFDLERLEVIGQPVSVLDDVWEGTSGAANYAVSRDGTLAYVRAAATGMARSLVWIDRSGRETAIRAPLRVYREARLSPDDSRVALAMRDEQHDIHVWDLARETLTRLTFDPGVDERPAWTADGRSIVFGSQRSGATNLFVQTADGSGSVRQLTGGGDEQHPAFVAADGSGILGTQVTSRTNGDIVWFPLSKPDTGLARAEPLINSGFVEWNPDMSPDGRYLAYQSNESGRDEIYVRPFPRVNDGRWQVSTAGGVRPVWNRSGRELFFVDATGGMIVVPVNTSAATFASGNARRLFDVPPGDVYLVRDYDVARDGTRFLMMKDAATGQRTATASMVVVLNWFEELKAKAAAAP
jgi:hypothetical protein